VKRELLVAAEDLAEQVASLCREFPTSKLLAEVAEKAQEIVRLLAPKPGEAEQPSLSAATDALSLANRARRTSEGNDQLLPDIERRAQPDIEDRLRPGEGSAAEATDAKGCPPTAFEMAEDPAAR